jgi:hypothetical protein
MTVVNTAVGSLGATVRRHETMLEQLSGGPEGEQGE